MTDTIRDAYRRFLDIIDVSEAQAIHGVIRKTNLYALVYVSVPQRKQSYYLDITESPLTGLRTMRIYKFDDGKMWLPKEDDDENGPYIQCPNALC